MVDVKPLSPLGKGMSGKLFRQPPPPGPPLSLSVSLNASIDSFSGRTPNRRFFRLSDKRWTNFHRRSVVRECPVLGSRNAPGHQVIVARTLHPHSALIALLPKLNIAGVPRGYVPSIALLLGNVKYTGTLSLRARAFLLRNATTM